MNGWEIKNIEIAAAQSVNLARETVKPKTIDEKTEGDIKKWSRFYFKILGELKEEFVDQIKNEDGRKDELKATLFEPNDHLPEELEDGINDFGQ